MSTFGVDLSAEYQPGFDVERAYREGVRFLVVKLSDDLKGPDRYEEGVDTLRRARALRMVGMGYHFMRADHTPQTGAEMFADQCARAGVTGIVDCEQGTIDQLRELTYELGLRKVRLPFLYLPRWWWERMGSPSLAGLPPLWGSRFYTSGGQEVTGPPSGIWSQVSDGWGREPYGGRPVRMLQFTRKAQVAGFTMDADWYAGSLADLERDTAWVPKRAYR